MVPGKARVMKHLIQTLPVNWSAEHRLGALQAGWKLAEAVLGAPVHGQEKRFPRHC